ncbi:MAG TPA: hypothetical protein VKY26_03280 [Actinomycetota bacterium]|nr:hypothetical protein [Actinomycetota bacterium]
MSLRANDPGPSLPDDFGQQKRSLTPYIVAAFVVAAVATIAFLAVTGRVRLPFVGEPVTTQADPIWHWSITFPKAWATKTRTPPASDVEGVRFESEGDNVGVRITAEPLAGVVTAADTRSTEFTQALTAKAEVPGGGRPDLSVLSGPNFGTINGVPYDQYLIDYHDFSSGVAVLLEDTDYFMFNGANLEIVTFETDQKYFAKDQPAFVKAVKTFHSKFLSEGVPASPSPTGVTATATSSPSTPPASTPTSSSPTPAPSSTPAASPSPAVTPTPSTSHSP